MKQDSFLQLYRTYEGLLRDFKGVEPKDEEIDVDDVTGGRLRMCRLFRNYFVHTQDPGFLEVSDKMGKFLSDYVDDMKTRGDVAKKHMKRPDVCIVTLKDHVCDVCDVFRKLKSCFVVVDMGDGTYGCVNIFDIIGTPVRTLVRDVRIKKVKPFFCSPMDDFKSLDSDRVTLCTDDGTSSGKLLGQIIF